MASQTNQPPQIYGFARRKRHFVWQEPVLEQPAPSDEAAGAGSPAELLDDVRQLAATSSGVAQEMLRVLESEGFADTDNPAEAAPLSPESASDPTSALPEQSPEPPGVVDIAESPDLLPTRPRPQKPRRRTKQASTAASDSSLDRHHRRCAICGTKYQEEIDDAFINWESVDTIARSYGIDRRSIYRHAHATGLFAQRDGNIRRALGLLIHRADKVRDISADGIILAAKTLAHINEHGQWTAPPTHIILSYAAPRPTAAAAPQPTTLIDTTCHSKPMLTP